MNTPKRIESLAEELTALPGIGPRQALRLAFYIADLPLHEVDALISGLTELKKTKRCELCFFIHEEVSPLCLVCNDTRRNPKIIAVIEKDTDRITLEHTKQFAGHYLIIGKLPKDGILSEMIKSRLQELTRRFPKDAPADEFILAFSPTTVGDVNASVISHILSGHAGKITRLGRGMPTGGEIEFADEETLQNALRNRN